MSKEHQNKEKPSTNESDVDKKDTFSQLSEEMPSLELPDIAKLETEKEQYKKKADDYWEKILRITADMENLRKRMEREVDSARKYSTEKIIQELLPVLDSLEQGLQIAEDGADAAKAIHEGMAMTLKMLTDVLGKFGIEVLEPEGAPYDPQHHEAMSMVEQPEVGPGVILQVIQKGYSLHGRVVRPARVIVSK